MAVLVFNSSRDFFPTPSSLEGMDEAQVLKGVETVGGSFIDLYEEFGVMFGIFASLFRGGEDEVLRLVFEVDRDNFVFGCDVDEFWALREYFKYALNVGRVYFFAFSAMIFLPVLLLAVARAVMFLPSARACTGA